MNVMWQEGFDLRVHFTYHIFCAAHGCINTGYYLFQEDKAENIIPTIISGWDHSPRAGENSLILTNYTPALFQKHLENVFDILVQKENKICFIKAWNEWGEGNHLEPDLKYGLDFLKTLKQVKESYFKK